MVLNVHRNLIRLIRDGKIKMILVLFALAVIKETTDIISVVCYKLTDI